MLLNRLCIDGFSLIELLITLTVIAIALGLAIPAFETFSQKAQSDVLSSQLLRAIYLTRNEAILRNSSVRLCGSMDQQNCSAVWQQGFIIRADEHVVYIFQNIIAEGILHWRSFPLNRSFLEFSATGWPRAQNGTFWFCPQQKQEPVWAISINQAGRARMRYPDKQGKILDDKGVALIC